MSERGLLRDRDFALLVTAVALSALGDWLALVPLALELQSSTDSGLAVAGLYMAVWGPAVFLAGPAGLAADTLENTRLLGVVSVVQAGIAVALAFAGSTGAIIALAALLGSGFAFAQTAEFALIPAIAGEERLGAANGYVETARYAGFTAGPLLGGLLAAAGGVEVALLVNAATFLFVAAVALTLRARRRPRRDPEVKERALEGFGFLFREPDLGLVVTVAFVSLLFFTASVAAEVFFATDFLEIGESGFGLLITCWTIGMVVGSVLIAPRVPKTMLAGGALLAIAVQGLGLGVPTLWLVPTLAFAFYFVGGSAHGTKNVLVRTLIHVRTPDRLRGRAFAAYNGVRNGAELVAMAMGGVMIALVDARVTLLLAGALPLIVGVAGYAIYRARAMPPAPADGPA